MDCYIDEARTPSQRRVAACITRWQRSNDRRALFGAAYAMALDTVMATARAGRFADSAFVLRLLEQCAEYYLVTVDPSDDDLTLVTPAAWQIAHSAAAVPATAPMDAVLLGCVAHVCNDLPQALSDVLRDEWPLSSAQLQHRRVDLDTMLVAMGEALTGMQCVLERFDAQLLAQGARVQVQRGPADRVGALFGAWAQQVWDDTFALLTAVNDPWWHALRESVECTAARRSHLLMCRIEHREALLAGPSRDIDTRFPHRHDGPACRIGSGVPVWGLESAAAG